MLSLPLPFVTHNSVMPDFAAQKEEMELTATLFLEHFSIRQRAPSFDFLGEIVEAYTLLPYENITKIIAKFAGGSGGKSPLLRSPLTVLKDYIRFGGGGTCYSLTHALATILQFLGYPCALFTCDIGSRPNAHCALMAEAMDGEIYYVDPGYLLARPMRFIPEQNATLDNGFALVNLNYLGEKRYSVTTTTDNETKERYRLNAIPLTPGRFLDLWRASFTSPGLGKILITTYAGDNGRLYLHHHQLRHITSSGMSKESISGPEYAQNIQKIFGISPELVEKAHKLLATWRAERRIPGQD